MSVKKYTKEEIDSMEEKTDYERVNSMTDEEIRENAQSDPDVPIQSEKELEQFRPAKRRGKADESKKS
ncbi:hypothetical protein [Endozoicomonas numazuensis]|uniref:Uncharacterized protein n=1 Tax=Endozoicomonas numazuensis TaxID=1137799 RepID=A0A081NJ59_9GAMM|nr:hypothetical protein [Endozoicomonas numazuensis]KEQ18482.1 hypothetical protein GZ78_13430 [Endozoicomonas numazuensis]